MEQFWEQFWAEFTHDNIVSLPVVLARMLLATLLGSIIGLEREWRRRPAGLKTHMLVCLASATFTIVSLELVNVPVFNDQNIRMDPSRLVEAITSGVAFLAAGFIIFARGKITGITTGAGMWLAASVGLASGLGLWHIAIMATFIAVAVLIVVGKMENSVGPDNSKVECKVGGKPS
ncbi:MgtC/SapB family protein [Brucella intermedia]|uniref:MgtC/SapB family protein n=1 Tax=Brucella intermedia TaxID=94625 RepID=UPI00235F5D93|nr:MgtC/SapB family protein [Brucella intermedia]